MARHFHLALTTDLRLTCAFCTTRTFEMYKCARLENGEIYLLQSFGLASLHDMSGFWTLNIKIGTSCTSIHFLYFTRWLMPFYAILVFISRKAYILHLFRSQMLHHWNNVRRIQISTTLRYGLIQLSFCQSCTHQQLEKHARSSTA